MLYLLHPSTFLNLCHAYRGPRSWRLPTSVGVQLRASPKSLSLLCSIPTEPMDPLISRRVLWGSKKLVPLAIIGVPNYGQPQNLYPLYTEKIHVHADNQTHQESSYCIYKERCKIKFKYSRIVEESFRIMVFFHRSLSSTNK